MTVGMSMFLTVTITTMVAIISLYIADTISQSKSPNCFSKTAHLSWKMLKQLYGINHDRWRYERVIATGCSSSKGWNKVILYNTRNVEENMWRKRDSWCEKGYICSQYIVRVKLSFFGWLMFNFNRIFNKKKDTVGTEMLLDSVSRDIEKTRQKAQEQIAEATKMMQDVVDRMRAE